MRRSTRQTHSLAHVTPELTEQAHAPINSSSSLAHVTRESLEQAHAQINSSN